MKISIARTIMTVTATSLLGMTLGGLFGYAAGTFAPQLFDFPMTPKGKIDPVAAAAIFALLRRGDHVVSSQFLFGAAGLSDFSAEHGDRHDADRKKDEGD